MFHELDLSFASIDHGVDENDGDLVLEVMGFDVVGFQGMHKHSEREGIGDTERQQKSYEDFQMLSS